MHKKTVIANSELLIFGSTGMLGQALKKQAYVRGKKSVGVARNNADITIDLCNLSEIRDVINRTKPELIINCAAIVDLTACENKPCEAYQVNSRAVAAMAAASKSVGAQFIHISTDHFFSGDGPKRHDEKAKVTLLNEYARTKYAGEAFALTAPSTLVVRTNITGIRGWGPPTFLEWIGDALINRSEITLFTDFHTSTLDSTSCADAILDLADVNASGLVNVASSTTSNKYDFAHILAKELEISLSWAKKGSILSLQVPRAESLGLDTSLAEQILGRKLPNSKQVAAKLAADYKHYKGLS